MNNTDILEACLKAIEQGKATVNDCVARYPHVEGLRDMLMAAQDSRTMERPVMAMTSRTALEQRLIARMETSRQQSRGIARLWTRVPVTLAATVLLVLILTAGVLSLSSRAIPGDILYGVKRTSEQVSLAFASAPDRPAVLARMAETRLGELTALASRGLPINKALPDTVNSLNAAAAVQPDPAVRAALYARGIETIAQLAITGQPTASLMTALLGIATTTPTPTETVTDTPTETVTATQVRSATRVPTRIPPTVTPAVPPTAVPQPAPSGGNGGSQPPTATGHETGDGGSHSGGESGDH